MNVTVDANVLLRAIVQDDAQQAQAAISALNECELAVIPLATLCEYVWVLSQGYKFGRAALIKAVQDLVDSAKVRMDRRAAQAGLAGLKAGGDFADGVIAFDGRRLGGTTFLSFDRKAVRMVAELGGEARRLGR